MNGIVFGCAVPHPPLLIPEIGKGEEQKISATINALNKLSEDLAQIQPEILFVISPHGHLQYYSMGVASSPYTKGSFNMWGVSGLNYKFNNDLQFVHSLQEECKINEVPLTVFNNGIYDLDWGVLVPLYYLMKKVQNISVVPATFSLLSYDTHFTFGKCVRIAAKKTNKKVAFIASGDLSHRLLPGAPAGYDPAGKTFDNKIVEYIKHLNSKELVNMDPNLIDRAGECGLRSLIVLLGALDGLTVKPEVLSYEGPFGVGYMVASFKVERSPREE